MHQVSKESIPKPLEYLETIYIDNIGFITPKSLFEKEIGRDLYRRSH